MRMRSTSLSVRPAPCRGSGEGKSLGIRYWFIQMPMRLLPVKCYVGLGDRQMADAKGRREEGAQGAETVGQDAVSTSWRGGAPWVIR